MQFTKHELAVLSNALNESLELLDKVDYTTRLGATETEAAQIMKKIGELLKKRTHDHQ